MPTGYQTGLIKYWTAPAGRGQAEKQLSFPNSRSRKASPSCRKNC
jgi:hypothetical protein